MRFLTRSIARKLGALYLLLTGLIVGLGAVVVFQTRAIARDAEILLEETREQAIATELLRDIEELQRSLALVDVPGRDWCGPALLAIERVERSLDALSGPAEDPSRVEHQEREDELLDILRADLRGLADAAERDEAPPAGTLERVDEAWSTVRTLIEETAVECTVAGLDVERERGRVTRLTLGSTLIALVLLASSSVLVLRRVVEPVRTLQDGVQRFARGDLDHRIDLETEDEFGGLASTFNDMARRVAETHSELEERVVERTREFLRAARLADLGVLAAGVAHEINNPLASISACAEGLQRRIQDPSWSAEDTAEYVSTIHTEALRAKEITGRLLELARQDAGELSDFRLGLILEHVRRTARFTGDRRRVTLELEVEAPDTVLHGNAGELTQVCMNLVGNAMDASPPGGVVTLRCGLEDGQLVVEVADRGEGIAPDDLERVFEPFFTTKRPGSGTGLGLALVEALVQSRGGRVSARSTPGEGSVFRVVLPLRWRAA